MPSATPTRRKLGTWVNGLFRGLLGERGNAQLKWFRVLATELRCRPGRCTRMIKAVLTVYYLEHTPFTA